MLDQNLLHSFNKIAGKHISMKIAQNLTMSPKVKVIAKIKRQCPMPHKTNLNRSILSICVYFSALPKDTIYFVACSKLNIESIQNTYSAESNNSMQNKMSIVHYSGAKIRLFTK